MSQKKCNFVFKNLQIQQKANIRTPLNSEKMKVAILQYPVIWADIEANLVCWEERLRALKGEADVALLPEMFTTGFCPDRPELAEEADGQTMTRLKAVAEETEMMICGSFICREGEKLYNRGFLLRPGMEPVFVDKRHLFQYAENKYFTAGDQRTVVEWRGAKFRYIICYDVRFPTWDRIDKANPYEILLLSANWPENRIVDFDCLVEARGTENQAYVAATNIVGDDGLGMHYNGHSVAYDTRHQKIVRFEDNESGTKIADFDMEALRHFREKLPLWRDAD